MKNLETPGKTGRAGELAGLCKQPPLVSYHLLQELKGLIVLCF